MKYVKMLGLLAVAAAALMAFTGTAAATQVTSPAGTLYTGKITATSSNSELHGAFISVSCTSSHVEGDVDSHGISGLNAVGIFDGGALPADHALTATLGHQPALATALTNQGATRPAQ